MTLTQLESRMTVGVSRSDIANAGSYVQFLNDAQRQICRDRSWKWMKGKSTLSLTAGQTTLALPTLFKELTSSTSPVHLISGGVEYPVDVWSVEKHKRRALSQADTAAACHLDDTVSPAVLDFIRPFDSDTSFTVLCYSYPADLVSGSDTNRLTIEHPEMLLALAKSFAFLAVNDPAAADFLALYQKLFDKASAADGYSQISGTQLRM